MSKFPPALRTLSNSFKWRTQDGRVLWLHEMKTSHIFNSMKMLFNHIAEAYGATPIWYQHSYEGFKKSAKNRPKDLARVVAVFCYEIERRGDLDQKYWEPYRLIMEQILGIKEWMLDALPEPVEVRSVTIDDVLRDMDDVMIEKHGLDPHNDEEWYDLSEYR